MSTWPIHACKVSSDTPAAAHRPVPDAADMILSNELRSGANRRGPGHVWDVFDRTVDRLALALEGNYAGLVSDEDKELGTVLSQIINALEPGHTNARDSGPVDNGDPTQTKVAADSGSAGHPEFARSGSLVTGAGRRRDCRSFVEAATSAS